MPQQRADAGTPARAAVACSPAVPDKPMSPVCARRRAVRAGYVTSSTLTPPSPAPLALPPASPPESTPTAPSLTCCATPPTASLCLCSPRPSTPSWQHTVVSALRADTSVVAVAGLRGRAGGLGRETASTGSTLHMDGATGSTPERVRMTSLSRAVHRAGYTGCQHDRAGHRLPGTGRCPRRRSSSGRSHQQRCAWNVQGHRGN